MNVPPTLSVQQTGRIQSLHEYHDIKNTGEDEIKELFAFLEGLGVDGMLVSPGFSFEHNENEIFLCRKEIQERFGFIYGISKNTRY